MTPQDMTLLLVACVIAGLLIFIVGLSVGIDIGRKQERIEALKRQSAWIDSTLTGVQRLRRKAEARRAELAAARQVGGITPQGDWVQ